MNHADTARRTVAEIINNLPATLRDAAREVPVCIEDWPSEEITNDGLDPGILGLFVGAPRHEHPGEPGPPPQILLYVENILGECQDSGLTFEEEIRRTYLHELGHYLGLDEDALADRDLD